MSGLFSAFKNLGHLGHLGQDTEAGPVPPANGYITEDALDFYVTEDGSAYYVQES